MLILPAIDIIEGKCVRLLKGEFDTAHKVAEDPLDVAAMYRDAGAEFIHVVDLDGARDGKRKNSELIARIVKAASPAMVELGGGIREIADIEAVIQIGVARVVLGSAAVRSESFVLDAVKRYNEAVAVGIDAQNGMVKVSGWTESTNIDFLELARNMQKIGIKTVIFTDIDTDGMLEGPNYQRLAELRAQVDVNLIASGGVSTNEDVLKLKAAGMDGAIIGKAIYSGTLDLKKAIMEAKNCG